MPTLTLARFVLEQCLLEYNLLEYSDSKMAAAALYLALKMKSIGNWTPTLQYYTGQLFILNVQKENKIKYPSTLNYFELIFSGFNKICFVS